MLPSSCPQVSSSTSSRAASLERSQVEPRKLDDSFIFYHSFWSFKSSKVPFPGYQMRARVSSVLSLIGSLATLHLDELG